MVRGKVQQREGMFMLNEKVEAWSKINQVDRSL